MFRSGLYIYSFGFWLNAYYEIDRTYKSGFKYKTIVRFVRSTEKGFNLVDVKTGKFLLKKGHLYDKRFSGVAIPENKEKFKVGVPSWLPEPRRVSSFNGVLYVFNTREMKDESL
jgi:hypothetical protein